MAIRIQSVSFDTPDPDGLATFWAAVLGWERTYEDDDEILVEPPEDEYGAPDLVFLRVPEPKTTKNRLHLDLRPEDQEAEVARLEALGAKRAFVGQGDDVSWVVMADPDGNEFCVLRILTAEELAGN